VSLRIRRRSLPDRKRLGVNVLVAVHARDGLLRGGNEVAVVLLVAIVGRDLCVSEADLCWWKRVRNTQHCVPWTHLVKGLVELLELGGLGHDLLAHHEGSLDLLVLLLAEEVKTVVDKGLVEVDTVVGEEVATVAVDLGAWVLARARG